MPPALPVTSTSSFPAVTDLCFSAFRIPSILGLPSATIEIQESSVALTEIVKACFEPFAGSEDDCSFAPDDSAGAFRSPVASFTAGERVADCSEDAPESLPVVEDLADGVF